MAQETKQPVAITLSDIHLSHQAPPCRGEEDWYKTQLGYINQLKRISQPFDSLLRPPIPIIAAGDIFDKWNPPLELVNWAIRYLPNMYAVPGQHDLPYHNYKDRNKSAYWTLVEAGIITNLEPGEITCFDNICLHGFPYGFPINSLEVGKFPLMLDIAVVHQYIWRKGYSYPNAPEENHVSKKRYFRDNGYDLMVFGDNHLSFTFKQIINNGAFIIRRSDEIGLKPGVTLIYSDGSFERKELDISKDIYRDKEECTKQESLLDTQNFLDELKGLAESGINFQEAVKIALKNSKLSLGAERLVLEATHGS